jgi:diamine N-acetyltransferase
MVVGPTIQRSMDRQSWQALFAMRHTRATVMDDVRIVECGPADAEDLAKIGRATFLETYSANTSPDDMRAFLREAYSPEAVRAEIDLPGSRFFIARMADAAAGYLKLNGGDAQGEQLEGVGLEIEAIYVYRRYHGGGIGSALMARAHGEANAIGADHIWLGVWELNRAAIRFYERNGFRELGARPFRFGSVEHNDLIMRRELGADEYRRNRAIAAAFHQAYNDIDLDRVRELLHASVEVRGHDGRVSRGPSEVVESMLAWREEWSYFAAELEDFIELGNQRALVVAHSVGTGRETGIKTEMRAGEIWAFRDGRVAAITLHRTLEEALAAAGIRG